MSMLIQHSLAAMNAERQFNIVTKAKNKKTEKLSSGYRINRAADDAAGLSISEKMRRQIRGLHVGTENAEMGISWVQIGEGALNEAHDILHRMNELSIKAQNGTNTLTDRAYMEAEFEQLQNELDRISTTTTFNELNIFEEHEPVYDQICGNIHWDYEEKHVIMAGRNDLVVEYWDTMESGKKTLTLTVPPGEYTTHELIDELDTAAGIDGPIHMEFTEKGFCKLNLEGGVYIDTVTGPLSYLLWDTYDGGGYGALIGTTKFMNPDGDADTIRITRGVNDKMTFQFEYFDDGKTVDLEIDLSKYMDPGRTSQRFNKTELMGFIDQEVSAKPEWAATQVKTSHHGISIMLSSDLGIVTGFKGNMFTIDGPDNSSVFYDNIQHGYVDQKPAAVVGGAVLTTDTRDKEHNRYYIQKGVNDKLVLYPNPETSSKTGPTTITIAENMKDGYTASDMVEELNKKFKAAGIDGEVQAYLVRSNKREKYPNNEDPSSGAMVKESVGDDSVYFEGVEIRTVKQGPDAIVNIAKVKDANNKDTDEVDKTLSTAYDTLFTIKDFNSYGGTATDAKVSNQTRNDVNAYVMGSKTISGNTVINKNNNSFKLTLSSTNKTGGTDFGGTGSNEKTYIITLDNGAYASAAKLAEQIQKKIDTVNNSELKGRLVAEAVDGKIQIRDADKSDDKILDDVNDPYLNWGTKIELSSNGGNNGYRTIFQKEFQYEVPHTETKTLENDKTWSFTPTESPSGYLTININGQNYNYYVGGASKPGDITGIINKETNIEFKEVWGYGENKSKNFTVTGEGTTKTYYYAGGSATGDSGPKEGLAGLGSNTPAQLEIGPTLENLSKTVVESGKNDQITLTLNGKTRTLTLAPPPSANPTDPPPTKWTYTQAQLVDALQDAIDDEFGEGMGGAVVSVKDNRLRITSRLPSREDGKDTSIVAYAQGSGRINTFFDSLVTDKTEAKCTSEQALKSSITLEDGVSDEFTFNFTDSKGSETVRLDLTDLASESLNRTNFVQRINDKLAGTTWEGRVRASVDGSNHLVLETIETGAQTRISYSSGTVTATTPNAKALFGDLTAAVQTTASITLNQTLKTSASFTGTKSFTFEDESGPHTVQIGQWSRLTGNNSLVGNLNNAFTAASLDVIASLDKNNRLVLTKNTAGGLSAGNPRYLHMSYGSGGTVMKDMFGVTQSPQMPGVTVSSSNNGKTFNIKNTSGGKMVVTISSTSDGGLLTPHKETGYALHTSAGGWHNADYSTVTSNTLNPNGIVLTRWNNDLEFDLQINNTTKATKHFKYELKLKNDGTATSLADIQTELQKAMDDQLGKDMVEVKLENNRLIFKAVDPGSQRQFIGLQSDSTKKTGGGFFHHVMCGYTEKTGQLSDREDINGEQKAEDIFAQGRHDVVSEATHLQAKISDKLELDLNFVFDKNDNGTMEADEKAEEKTITVKLDLKPNAYANEVYTAEELRTMIQEKLNDALTDPNGDVQKKAKEYGIKIHKDLIDVNLGKYATNVEGNRDTVSLSFSITTNPDIATPVEGFFYIDGVKGNAAYETFYRTEGELIPAYIIGTKDVSKGVTLGPDDKELIFTIDGEEKKVTLDPGKYSGEELVEALKKAFTDQKIPLGLEITTTGFLKVSHERMGKHVIEKVTGSARDKIFFQEHADKRPAREREIRVSSNEGDRISVYSPRFSTTMLGINSICVSTVKNAEKATNRLKEAIKKVSDMRNTFGAIQNRIEHTINNNRNKEENTQAAESRIRDADISTEMVEFSNLSIIQQAGQAVLAQANQSRNGMLSLLT